MTRGETEEEKPVFALQSKSVWNSTSGCFLVKGCVLITDMHYRALQYLPHVPTYAPYEPQQQWQHQEYYLQNLFLQTLWYVKITYFCLAACTNTPFHGRKRMGLKKGTCSFCSLLYSNPPLNLQMKFSYSFIHLEHYCKFNNMSLKPAVRLFPKTVLQNDLVIIVANDMLHL